MFYFPTTGAYARRITLLGLDDSYFALRRNVCLHMSQPDVRAEPVLTPGDSDAPDGKAAHFYGTVLYDQGKYRMWYEGMSIGANPDMPAEEWAALQQRPGLQHLMMGPICYAESEDGIHWVKPNLGQLKFKGNTDNNALNLPDAIIHCPTVIKDDEDPNPDRRYKMVYQYYLHTESIQNMPTMRTATSADGIHWTAGPRGLIEEFVEHCSFYKYNGYYIVNGQTNEPWRKGEGGAPRGRQGFVYISADFEHWLQESAESFALPEPHDPGQRGYLPQYHYDQVHLGTAPIGYGHMAVGLYCIWHNQEPFAAISGDFGLVLSDDGIRFREPVKGHLFLPSEASPVTALPDRTYPTVLCQANGIVNVGDETRIYHGRWRNTWQDVDSYYAEVALAVLPRDRWGAIKINPNRTEGSLLSAPIKLPRHAFEWRINADGVSGIRIELTDEKFQPLPEFSGEHCGTVLCDGLEERMMWPRGSMERLVDQTVRIRIIMNRDEQTEPAFYGLYGVMLSE